MKLLKILKPVDLFVALFVADWATGIVITIFMAVNGKFN
jgi:ABC-type Co2+ transport system permease subunit